MVANPTIKTNFIDEYETLLQLLKEIALIKNIDEDIKTKIIDTIVKVEYNQTFTEFVETEIEATSDELANEISVDESYSELYLNLIRVLFDDEYINTEDYSSFEFSEEHDGIIYSCVETWNDQLEREWAKKNCQVINNSYDNYDLGNYIYLLMRESERKLKKFERKIKQKLQASENKCLKT